MKVSKLIRILQDNKDWAEREGKPEPDVYILLSRDTDPYFLKKWEGKWPKGKYIDLISLADSVWAYPLPKSSDKSVFIHPSTQIHDGVIGNAEQWVGYIMNEGDIVIEGSNSDRSTENESI
jgi:hypothetical protein